MNHRAVLRALALMLCLVPFLHARDVNPVLLSTYPPPSGGTTTDIAASGNLVYACEGEKGVTILDVTNPSAPQFLGSIDTPGFASAIVISTNLAYVADGSTGLTILDVSNPSAPKILGAYDTPGNCTDVAVAGTLAYLADGDNGLQIIDCSNPAQPVRLGGYNTFGTALSVAISGNYAFVADGDNGLVVIDISNPAAPRKVSGYATLPATHITVSGAYAYISSNGPLAIFDISDPLNPDPISSASLPGVVSGSSVSGTTAYVASGIGGFAVLDTTDPFGPNVLGTTTLLSNAVRVANSGSLAFVADLSNGVRVIAAQNPAVMDVVGHIPIPGNIRDIVVSDNYLYLVDGQAMRIIDVSKIEDMRVVGTTGPIPFGTGVHPPTRIVISDTYAYVWEDSFSVKPFYVASISDPANPTMLYHASDLRAQNMVAQNGYLYLVNGFEIGQFSLPNGITMLGALNAPVATNGTQQLYFTPDAIAVRGTTSWSIGAESTLSGFSFGRFVLKINVSNPGAPSVITTSSPHNWAGTAQMQIGGTNGFIVALNSSSGTQVLQAFDLDSLADVSARNVNAVQRFDVSTNTIYLAKGSNGVEVVRLESGNLLSIGGAGLPDATAIATTTNYVFVGAGTNGLYALTYFQPAIQLQTSFTTNKTPVVKAFGPIGTSGRLQRASDLRTDSFQDWQTIQLNSYPQIVTDTNSPRAFYRFVSP